MKVLMYLTQAEVFTWSSIQPLTTHKNDCYTALAVLQTHANESVLSSFKWFIPQLCIN